MAKRNYPEIQECKRLNIPQLQVSPDGNTPLIDESINWVTGPGGMDYDRNNVKELEQRLQEQLELANQNLTDEKQRHATVMDQFEAHMNSQQQGLQEEIKNNQGTIVELSQRLSQTEGELTAKNARLRQELEFKNQLEYRGVQLEAQIASIQQEITRYLEKTHAENSNEINTLRNALQEKQNQFQEGGQQLRTLTETIGKREGQIQQANTELDKYRAEIAELKNLLATGSQEITQLNLDKSEMHREWTEIQTLLNNKQQEVNRMVELNNYRMEAQAANIIQEGWKRSRLSRLNAQLKEANGRLQLNERLLKEKNAIVKKKSRSMLGRLCNISVITAKLKKLKTKTEKWESEILVGAGLVLFVIFVLVFTGTTDNSKAKGKARNASSR
tara:strand:- start:2524 stop:3684 length:1161 start_codon:yes stop_codon:yes gene_type:complete